MKHPIRKALTAILVMTLPFCGGLVPSIPMRVSAAGGSASDIYANSISSIPLSMRPPEWPRPLWGGPRPSFPSPAEKPSMWRISARMGATAPATPKPLGRLLNPWAGREPVLFPEGSYYCADIRVPSGVTLMSMTTFGFDGNGATQLVRNKANASCILDLTGSRDVTVYGISLDGLSKSAQSHGHGVKVVGAKTF